jgi:hypothetical protein
VNAGAPVESGGSGTNGTLANAGTPVLTPALLG